MVDLIVDQEHVLPNFIVYLSVLGPVFPPQINLLLTLMGD